MSFDTHPKKLEHLLESIDQGEIVLPEFQRDFVWYPKNTWELIISISKSYPAGSLLFLKYSHDVLAYRLIDGVGDDKKSIIPSKLILDGQQRLSSLYQAFYSRGEHRYFIALKELEKGELENALFYVRTNYADEKYKDKETQFKKKYLPLSFIFGPEMNLDQWIDEFKDYLEDKGADRNETRESIGKIRDTYLRPIQQYEFPVIELSEDTELDAVCQIFETLNRTGIKLTVFELLTARYWPKGINLRKMWDEALEKYSLINKFEIEPVTVLQTISLISNKKPSCKRKDLLNLNDKDIRELWEDSAKSLEKTLTIIKSECGALIPRWLPYTTLLPVFSAVLYKNGAANGPDRAIRLQKLKRWYWCSVFGQRYESSTDEKNAQDYIQLTKWLEGGEEPEAVKEFNFDAGILSKINKQRNSVYRGVICLILKDHAIDFHSGNKITTDLIINSDLDDHHIFPKAYLQNLNYEDDKINCVLNRTLIDAKTNKEISDKSPQNYFNNIKKSLRVQFEEILKSHLIPIDAVMNNDCNGFFADRDKLIEKKIKKATRVLQSC